MKAARGADSSETYSAMVVVARSATDCALITW